MNVRTTSEPNGGWLGVGLRISALAGLLGTLIAAPSAHAIEVDAGDYTALPDGTNVAILYAQYAENTSLYTHNRQAPIHAELDTLVGIARVVHFMNVGGHIIDPQFLVPFGNLRAKEDVASLGSANGLGDLILGATVWLVNRPETNTYFGITPFVYAPTGNYNKDHALNLGENRWKYVLNAGYITGLTDKLTLDLYSDVTFYGNNNRYGPLSAVLKQDPVYQTQGFLRYTLSKAWDLRGGVSCLYGGHLDVDGADQHAGTRIWKFQVGTGWFVTPAVQLLATYGRDIAVANGFKESHRINLRLMHVL
jgi:Putative MetA-pathway of phenol degradation